MKRKFPIGPEIFPNGINFRVYASKCKKVEIIIENSKEPNSIELKDEKNGYFSGTIPNLPKNTLYRFRLNGKEELYPDPASHFQPDGPFGPSQVIDHSEFKWKDSDWKGIQIEGQIIYEMHVGTYTLEGTFSRAEKELSELANLGITTIELMPLADFPGQFGWGYDGVNLFAPTRLYGMPNDLKSFINIAHQLKLAVILDLVYNHFGPSGNFISKFSDDYFHEEETEWGKGINFEKLSTLEFYQTNLRYWMELFHFDGFRVDALQGFKSLRLFKDIHKILKKSAKNKKYIIVGEDEPQDANLVRSIKNKGYGFDALWNDDFHHTARVCLTGSREGYYKDYTGTAQELLSCLKNGFLFQGQYYTWQEKNRGGPALDIKLQSFIIFIQNHDQIGNSPLGLRIHELTDSNNFRTMSCLMLLAPSTPMIFQGQEFASSSPFFYFADHKDELIKIIHEGRKDFLSQFRHALSEEVQKIIPNPADPLTFTRSKLDHTERITHSLIYNFYKDVIHLRKTDPVFSFPKTRIDGAVFNQHAFLVRFFGENEERLLLLNFSNDLDLNPAPFPLIAPPQDNDWDVLFSSESLMYGGQGTPPFFDSPCWKLPRHSAIVLYNKPSKKKGKQ